ncbi:contact-dependent growth inhibition system immunity protein [Nocardioides sp. SR21]|uniref:contact-dependent growth inhibition system immunity protein n=1 Tax=Nocardioides sp. SR21 TaxID=2919501 RepID=UPI001FA9BF3A|nr:contact-dependent growth inhibition system immunity protein [Nocardioides sp. SR21]
MSDLDERFPALWHLMGAYLHQDYDLTGTIDENIDRFVTETPDLAPKLPAEVEEALLELTTEEELDAFVDALGCQVLPPDNLSHREWLTGIAARVRRDT